MTRLRSLLGLALVCCAIAPGAAGAERHITTPKEQLGFNLGDDYQLADYKQLTDYWTKLAKESERIRLVPIGTTEEGRTMLMAVITSPANQRALGKYRDIARRLCLAEGVSEPEARKLAKAGKAVVWIDGGLHASEVLGAQQLMETVYQLVSGEDEETRRLLNDDIVLAVLANPDGMDLCSQWYMREADPKKRSLSGLPRLYQKYIGHDDNRDFYASTQSETKAMNRVMYREWYPQIVYNHHQTGPAGTVLFMPPFRDPFNYNFDPLIPAGIDAVGAAMENRLLAEGKTGATTRSGMLYSTWWNGGLRTTCYFHNMIGLLTETIGSPTPTTIPFIAAKQLPKADLLAPAPPGPWHFRQSIDYSVSANKAVLDYASRYRETLLYNIWRMGTNSIERGSRDSWTVTPKKLTAPRKPEGRDPRGYVIPANQFDFPTATKFVNALIETGVTVQRATADFDAGGRRYSAGSYVVKCAQAFRPHVLDMFEPQDHPDDFAYPGAPPTPPYDLAGYTLAMQMGVKYDRLLEDFSGPFEKLADVLKPPAGKVAATSVGWLMRHEPNTAITADLRILAAGGTVEWLTIHGMVHAEGTTYVPAGSISPEKLQAIANELGVSFEAAVSAPMRNTMKLHTPRVALWDQYGGSMPSGWIRWLLERFEIPFQVVYPPDLDAGGLRQKYDVIILPDGAVPVRGGGRAAERTAASTPAGDQPRPDDAVADATIPQELRARRGSITQGVTLPQLRRFMEEGGTVVAIGSATRLAEWLKLPVEDALTEIGDDGTPRRLPREKFYVPGSLLEARVDSTSPLAWGMAERPVFMFDRSPAFRLGKGAEAAGIRRVAWFDSDTPLRSGWAWGQKYLKDAAAALDVPIGRGRMALFGPEITFRAQPHGTFKLLFNAILLSAAEQTTH